MRRQTYRRESYRRRRPDDPQVLLRERKPQTYGLRTTAYPRWPFIINRPGQPNLRRL